MRSITVHTMAISSRTLGEAVLTAPEDHVLQTKSDSDSDSDWDDINFAQRAARSAMAPNLQKSVEKIDKRAAEAVERRAEQKRQLEIQQEQERRRYELRLQKAAVAAAKRREARGEADAADDEIYQQEVAELGREETDYRRRQRRYERLDKEHKQRTDAQLSQNVYMARNTLVDNALTQSTRLSQKERRSLARKVVA